MVTENEFNKLEAIRQQIEAVGGQIEVVRNLGEPDFWDYPENKPYEYIVAINLDDLTVPDSIFECLLGLSDLVTLSLHVLVLMTKCLDI